MKAYQFEDLQNNRKDLRPYLMAKFPFPDGHEKCSPNGAYIRSSWREITRFCANHLDGDCRGGETGHAEKSVALMIDRVLELKDLVDNSDPDALNWLVRLEKQKTAV